MKSRASMNRIYRHVWNQTLVAGAVVLTGGLFLAPFAQAESTADPASKPAAVQPMSGGANAITQAAVQQGALNCATRINQVSNFLGFGPQAGAVLMMPPSQPDQRLIPLAMEVPTEGGSAYVWATFARNQLRSNMKESPPAQLHALGVGCAPSGGNGHKSAVRAL